MKQILIKQGGKKKGSIKQKKKGTLDMTLLVPYQFSRSAFAFKFQSAKMKQLPKIVYFMG